MFINSALNTVLHTCLKVIVYKFNLHRRSIDQFLFFFFWNAFFVSVTVLHNNKRQVSYKNRCYGYK